MCLCTAAAAAEKATGSIENLIPGLIAFPGKSLRDYRNVCILSQAFLRVGIQPLVGL